MGQNESKPTLSPSSPKSFYIAASTGSKLKRAFARRKKSQDPAIPTTDAQKPPRKLPLIPQKSKDVAPSPPAKPAALQVAKKPVPLPPIPPQPIIPANRASVIPITPGVSSAVNFIIAQDRELNAARQQEKVVKAAETSLPPVDAEVESEAADKSDSKEAWRKSDATITHRPGAGGRPSRPVSMAESLQSTHTVTAVNKRLSALIADGDLVEEDEDHKQPSRSSPTASLRSKPRSMSLNTPSSPFQASPISPKLSSETAPPMTSPKLSSETAPPMTPSMIRETPTLTRAAASGIIAPSSSGLQSTGNNIRGRLAAWTATANTNSTNSTPTPGSHAHAQTQAQSRQPTVSLSASLAPAAGLAKRAVEKMGRWGFGSGSSNASSSSTAAPSSYSGPDYGLVRTNSNNSGGGKHSKHRKMQHSTSSAWSISSSSVTDLDAFAPPPEADLGKCLRRPLRVSNTGASVGGVVFGVALKVAIREAGPVKRPKPEGDVPPLLWQLEQRLLPALVVRCAQHLLVWGVQEEGLFRVSGRPSHTNKLRTEFDSGADYDMSECTPGDLDPHSVASVFKAYLRELPDPILTQGLAPYFEAALAQENALEQERNPRPRAPVGQGLPSGPRAGQMMRKPPSLSTLAQPNFNSLRPPSQSLLNALRSLVGQLPPENRDLLRTVTELIRATAKQSKETKMPLSNLLLVFCPSLNMNPPLLRVLCEAEVVWEDAPIVDIKRESLGVLDIRASPKPAEEDEPPLPSPTRPRFPGARTRRAHPAAVYVDDDESSLSQILGESGNAASDVSSVSTSGDTSIASRLDASSPLLSSSSESLATPSSGCSLDHGPLERELDSKPTPLMPDSPDLTENEHPHQSSPHSPIHFPTLTKNPPATPLRSTRSIPTLSLPSLPSPPKVDTNNSPSSPPPSPFRRLKKTSLHLLFSKRSASPLTSPTGGPPTISGPYLYTPRAASDTSLSTPNSAVTAPQGSTPPVLDTPIESSPLRLELGIEIVESPDKETPDSDSPAELETVLPAVDQTPIADMYRNGSVSSLAVNHPRAQPTRQHIVRQTSKASIASSNHLGMLEDEHEEDWTQSVIGDIDWRKYSSQEQG
ncbi:Rho-GAP domain-containing protein [Mycena kentingensis (nom. inval.)]|nr:Rho-GAP domain-containing protein [Mycena kentingensis (nom. inval.)]